MLIAHNSFYVMFYMRIGLFTLYNYHESKLRYVNDIIDKKSIHV